MKLAPAVIVHGLEMAQTALAPGYPVTLLSADGAGAYGGVGWWQALVGAARAAYPGTPAEDVLDCGDAAGRALEAIRAGQRLLILRAAGAIWHDIAGRAETRGFHVFAEAPPALDLGERGAGRRLEGWLKQPSPHDKHAAT